MTNQALSHLNHCSFSLNYHLVIVTKYRKKCINELMLTELKNICERLCEQWECKMLEFSCEEISKSIWLNIFGSQYFGAEPIA